MGEICWKKRKAETASARGSSLRVERVEEV